LVFRVFRAVCHWGNWAVGGNRSNEHNSFDAGKRDKKVAVKLKKIKKESRQSQVKKEN
jgi:hypothetical protein